MSSLERIIRIAKETISIEQKAIANLENLVDEEFAEAVSHIYNSNGRVVISGIGKSANIATKIVATLNSTGTPSNFHARC
jgi:arabinose-5-phosphate isomerase